MYYYCPFGKRDFSQVLFKVPTSFAFSLCIILWELNYGMSLVRTCVQYVSVFNI